MTVAVIILDLRFRLPFLLHELTVSYRRPASRASKSYECGRPAAGATRDEISGWLVWCGVSALQQGCLDNHH